MFSSVAKRALVNSVEELALNNTKPLNIIIIIIILLYGVGGKLLKAVMSLYVGSKACVMVGSEFS